MARHLHRRRNCGWRGILPDGTGRQPLPRVGNRAEMPGELSHAARLMSSAQRDGDYVLRLKRLEAHSFFVCHSDRREESALRRRLINSVAQLIPDFSPMKPASE